MAELRSNYTIVIVTHNMQQASRVSDFTAFFTLGEDRAGYLAEMDATAKIFTNPQERIDRGLCFRPVRLEALDDRREARAAEPARPLLSGRPARPILATGASRRSATPLARQAPRPANRWTASCAPSRMTSCGWAASWRRRLRGAVAPLISHDAAAALAVIEGDCRINEMQRRSRTRSSRPSPPSPPVARDLRS